MRVLTLSRWLRSTAALRGTGGEFAQGQSKSRNNLLMPLGFAVVTALLAASSMLSIPASEQFDDGVNYAIDAVTQLAAAVFVLRYARRATGTMRVRWMMFASAPVLFAMGYSLASLIGFQFLNNQDVQSAEVLLSATGYALLLLCPIFLFSQSTRTMALLDTLQALLFAALRYGVIYSPKTHDLFTDSHLQISIWTPVFLFFLVRIAKIGAATQAEARLLRVLLLFLGFRSLSNILLNQVSYLWLHNRGRTVWDISQILADASFCFLALALMPKPLPAERTSTPPIFVRNLMPSIIAFGNLILALLLLRYYPVQAVEAVLCTAVCYVLRTLLLQTQVGTDRQRLMERNEHLEQLVTRDTLTGVGNRRSLIAALGELSRTRARQPFALAILDVDWFKQANDEHGHLYGDHVLVSIAAVLQTAAEGIAGGHCARLGGDEFAILLPGQDTEAAKALADDVRQRVRELDLRAGDRVITVSVGVTAAQASLTFETTMSRADESLYRAKALGRDRVELWREPVPIAISLMPNRAEAV